MLNLFPKGVAHRGPRFQLTPATQAWQAVVLPCQDPRNSLQKEMTWRRPFFFYETNQPADFWPRSSHLTG